MQSFWLRIDDTLVIGDATVTVMALRGLHKTIVRLGVKAPPEVRIDRQEIHERRKLAQRTGANHGNHAR